MTVRVERREWPCKDGTESHTLVVDIRTRGPDGTPIRERRKVPDGVRTDAAALRWGEARLARLAGKGHETEEVPAPTLADFAPRWMREYAVANANKPSTLAAKETINRLHLVPVLGRFRLDEIGAVHVQRLKLHLAGFAPKTKACVLSQLATLLTTAERWEEIIKAPHIELPSIPDAGMGFYDFEEFEALVVGARCAGPMVLAAILLGGDAGLRRGELVALEQGDVGKGAATVQRNEWEGQSGSPKGGRARRIPLTGRLAQAIEEIRHLRGKRLLWQTSGEPVKVTTLQSWMEVATKRAGLPPSRNLHKLRHTFCSHLAMRGAPAKVIQELAGHADLKTTMRYMHLAKGSAEAAIALLEGERTGSKSRERVNS